MAHGKETASSLATPFEVPMLINGAWRASERQYDVVDPYRGGVVCRAR
jgi:hypothetical protein